jgi:hypothetical protein
MSDAFVGMGIMGIVGPVLLAGKTPTPSEVQTMAMILAGNHDKEIKAAFAILETGSAHPTEEQMDLPIVLEKLHFLKARCRHWIQGVFDAAAQQEEKEKQQQHKAILADVQSHNKPHPLGTVDELAKKFGVSKSEIRRRKAEGTL